jgi:S1-C subfamily serine protease
VVSLKHRLILTNRHVVCGGAPTVIDGLLHNKEELALKVLYIDPIHDFAFLSFDAGQIKYHKLEEIELDPEGARVGREIRIMGMYVGRNTVVIFCLTHFLTHSPPPYTTTGNDAGEKIQILPGIIARLDRDSPFYGGGYNDWNTFYISAASSTSGGSSGSPVLASDGKAVALNCGAAKSAASSFYLPLHRVKRALDLIIAFKERASSGQEGEGKGGEGGPRVPPPPCSSSTLVPRGTLLTIFKHKAFDELCRLGLTAEVQASVRVVFPAETGMLVVEQCLKNGPAEGILEPGDILLEVGGVPCTTFLPLEEILDSHVGEKVVLRVQRGGEDRVVDVEIRDLHALMPHTLFTVSSAILHPVTVHMAKSYHLEAGTGVHLASTGYMFSRAGITIHCIILSVGGRPTPTIAALEQVFATLPDGDRTSVSFHSLTDRFRVRTAIIQVDKKWFAPGRYVNAREEGDNTLCWTFQPCKGEASLPAVLPTTTSSTTPSMDTPIPAPSASPISSTTTGMTSGTTTSNKPKDSLVMVSFAVPYLVDGMSGAEYIGAGIVIDKENGLVLVDRSTAPATIGDGLITFGGVLEVPAKCVFVHPLHNIAVLQYDACFLESEAQGGLVTVAEAEFAEAPPLDVGESLIFHGLSSPFIPVTQRATITKKETLKLADGRPPTFVSTNASVFHCDHAPGANGIFVQAPGASGDLSNSNGSHQPGNNKIVALRLCYAYSHDGDIKQVYRSVSAEIVTDTVRLLKRGGPPPRTLDLLPIKFTQMQLSKVKAGMGLSETQFRRLSKKIQETDSEASLLVVRRVPTELGAIIKTGDVLLSVGGEPVVRPMELERAVVAWQNDNSSNGGGDTSSGAAEESGEPTTRVVSKEGGLTLVVLREHEEVAIQARTTPLSTLGTDRVLLWCGLMLQEAHLPVSFLGYKPAQGAIYVSRWMFGSPSHKYGLRASFFIESINGIATPDLDTFLSTVTNTLHNASIRIKGLDLDGKPKSYTLKPCYQYWPTTEILFKYELHEWQLHHYPAPLKAVLHAA